MDGGRGEGNLYHTFYMYIYIYIYIYAAVRAVALQFRGALSQWVPAYSRPRRRYVHWIKQRAGGEAQLNGGVCETPFVTP